MNNTPTLSYFISDTFGRKNTNPLKAPEDPDVLLSTDLARLEDVLENGDRQELRNFQVHQKINAHGRCLAIGQHLSHLLCKWNQEHRTLLERAGIYTGLFINDAPRIQESGGSSPEFHEIETDNFLKIVASPVEAAATVGSHAISVKRVPNRNNGGLWEDETQFRSEKAHKVLRINHPYASEPVDTTVITKSPVLDDLRCRFVDIYGNIVCYGGKTKEVAAKLRAIAGTDEQQIEVAIGEKLLNAYAAKSLEHGQPGQLIVYPNGGNPEQPNIDIVRKWNESRTSAYEIFDQPVEGIDEVHINFSA